MEDLRAALGLAVTFSRIADVDEGSFGLQLQHLRTVALTSVFFQSLRISLEVVDDFAPLT